MAKDSLVPVVFRGYTKRENGHFVAVCVDLNIVAQGATQAEASERCHELIIEFIEYVCTEYGDLASKYMRRPVPREFLDEYNDLAASRLFEQKPKRSRQLHNFSFTPGSLAECAS